MNKTIMPLTTYCYQYKSIPFPPYTYVLLLQFGSWHNWFSLTTHVVIRLVSCLTIWARPFGFPYLKPLVYRNSISCSWVEILGSLDKQSTVTEIQVYCHNSNITFQVEIESMILLISKTCIAAIISSWAKSFMWFAVILLQCRLTISGTWLIC